MSLAIFNINDAGIQIAVDGELICTSPGYAVLDGDRLLTGKLASASARLLPRWTNNRFWGDLNTNLLTNGTQQVRHHADLAFTHLEDLWLPIKERVSEAIFVVPSYYTNENLSLLLGLAKECQLPISGIVDQAVLSASNLPLRSVILHLDIHLHGITLTRLSNDGSLTRVTTKTVIETGLFTLWDRWANIIAKQFIQVTRFDPMHQAKTEQKMFDQLPGWIRGLSDVNMLSFNLELDDTDHSVAISKENLIKACAPIYPQIIQAIRAELPSSGSASLLLSHRFAGFPGLNDSLGLIPNLEVSSLSEMKSIGSATLLREQIINKSGAVSHTLQLRGELIEHAEALTALAATHLLSGHTALPIGSGFKLDEDFSSGIKRSQNPICTFYPRNNQLIMDCQDTSKVTINDQPASAMNVLESGDVVSVNKQQIVIISVPISG